MLVTLEEMAKPRVFRADRFTGARRQQVPCERHHTEADQATVEVMGYKPKMTALSLCLAIRNALGTADETLQFFGATRNVIARRTSYTHLVVSCGIPQAAHSWIRWSECRSLPY